MDRVFNATATVALGFAIGLVLANWPAVEAREIEQLNLTERITLTLANSLSQEYQYGPDDVGELAKRADFYIDDREGVYSYSFRTRVGEFSGSGYYRIASPTRHRRPKTEEGWRALTGDRKTGAEVWFREVRKSDAETYNEVQASLVSGNFALTASVRRPASESAERATQVILERFGRLLDNARRYGIELVKGEKGEPLADGGLLNVLGAEKEQSRVRFRVYAADSRGSPLANVDYYVIKLSGFLGEFARVEGAAFNEEKGQYEVHNPAEEGAEVVLIIPAFESTEFAGAMARDAKMKSGFGITIGVDAIFKPEKKEVVS
jgi:hypothetical protein